MKQRKNYHVQHHAAECVSCRNFDAIRESIIPGDKGKQKVFICQLDHLPVEKSGVCDLFNGR